MAGLKVLICPDKFKGSLSAQKAAKAIARGVRRAWPEVEITLQPLADGGEGSMELLGKAFGLKRRTLQVAGPLRRPVDASYYLGNGRAVIESAAACGLHLVPPQRRNPEDTTTIGVGMLVDDALARGAREIFLLLGGSSTNDCGAGMAAALGYRFLTAEGYDIVPMAGSLSCIRKIDAGNRHPGLKKARITTLCDVDNPLLGPSGATHGYARQKGASQARLPELEEGMAQFAALIHRDLGREVTAIRGGGAAGGLGVGSVAFLGAYLKEGTEVIFSAVGFTDLAQDADLVITGEGSIDEQTLHGKVVAAVLQADRPTIAVCGHAELSAEELGVSALLSLDTLEDLSLQEKMDRAAELIERMVYDYCLNNPSAGTPG